MDWYSYLTKGFKLDRTAYSVADRAVFDCPKCRGTSISRINHVKAKIRKIGRFECSKCRKKAGMAKARRTRWRNEARKELSGDSTYKNWFE